MDAIGVAGGAPGALPPGVIGLVAALDQPLSAVLATADRLVDAGAVALEVGSTRHDVRGLGEVVRVLAGAAPVPVLARTTTTDGARSAVAAGAHGLVDLSAFGDAGVLGTAAQQGLVVAYPVAAVLACGATATTADTDTDAGPGRRDCALRPARAAIDAGVAPADVLVDLGTDLDPQLARAARALGCGVVVTPSPDLDAGALIAAVTIATAGGATHVRAAAVRRARRTLAVLAEIHDAGALA